MPELTTLCYINKGDKVLFIHKTEKDDSNCGKYLGVGGHIEEGESPDECIIREIREESGISISELGDFKYSGLVTFVSDKYGVEYMHVYKASYEGVREVTPGSCPEGNLVWIPLSDIYDLPVWEGDKVMFDCLYKEDCSFFTLRLEYQGDKLISCSKRCQ